MTEITCLDTKSQDSSSTDTLVHDTVGNHVIAELNDCCPELLADLEHIRSAMEEGVKKSNATIINSHFHRFSPTGVSGVILLSESHASIHTWPDQKYASIDIYTCGDHVNPRIAYEYIANCLKSQNTKLTVIERGLNTKGSEHIHKISETI